MVHHVILALDKKNFHVWQTSYFTKQNVLNKNLKVIACNFPIGDVHTNFEWN